MQLIKDLLCSKDGSFSVTKLAVVVAHANFAVAFTWLTYRHGFNEALWVIYGSFAVGHAAYDKSAAMLKAYKEREK